MTVSAHDPVNHPSHYVGTIECIDAIQQVLGADGFAAYCRGNALKYLWRACHKTPGAYGFREDLEKAEWYLSKLLEVIP